MALPMALVRSTVKRLLSGLSHLIDRLLLPKIVCSPQKGAGGTADPVIVKHCRFHSGVQFWPGLHSASSVLLEKTSWDKEKDCSVSAERDKLSPGSSRA